MSITIELDLDTARPIARAVQSRLEKLLGTDVPLGQAFEVLAAVAGEPEWNVLAAKLKASGDTPTKSEPPVSMCVVIELIDASDLPKYAKHGITPAMLVEAAEAYAAKYYGKSGNPTAEVVKENFDNYMESLIEGDRPLAQPSWLEEWQASRGSERGRGPR